jgi:hypothetical protein
MKCAHRKGIMGTEICSNKAVAKISFDLARVFSSNYRKPYGNRMKKIACCEEHLKLQEKNLHIMNLEVEKI